MKLVQKMSIALLLLIPSLSFGTGDVQQGTVTLTGNTLSGFYSVRFNPNVNKGSVTIYAGPTVVGITAITSDTGTWFTCQVFDSHPIFKTALEAAQAAGYGTRLVVTQDPNTGYCSNINYYSMSSGLNHQ